MIKTMTKEEKSVYRHEAYLRRRDKQLSEQREYYLKHKKEILDKASKRYRNKCGLN